MRQSAPLLTTSHSILWLKVALSVAALAWLYLRYRRAKASGGSPVTRSFGTKVVIGLSVLFSFGVFHSFGAFPGGSFVHHAEMFHYYLGSKYFEELGYDDLYDAVIVADTEQGNALAPLPFYTDLRTYQNAPRDQALANADRVRRLFAEPRWNAFKADVAFFKEATDLPRSPQFFFMLMDHGYNASPASTFVLRFLTNAVPVTALPLLAALDVLLVVTMITLVFRTFGFDAGALFSTYFFVNVLNDPGYVSGGLLRYDWLFCLVVAVCLLERGRHASSAVFLALAAMMRVFPAVSFLGVAVTMIRKARATGRVERESVRFVVAAGVAAAALFLLPGMSLGSVLQPWKDFSTNTALHDRGVYVNHLGLRGMVLFEPSHLSLAKFAETFRSDHTDDIVRRWQDVKEKEFEQKRPIVVVATLFVLACLIAILWKGKASESEGVLWPSLLIYTMGFLSHYYYAFLCLFVLLFFPRIGSLRGFVPLCLLLLFNIGALVTDSFRPSPIVFYTLTNIGLFVCLFAILAFELHANVFGSEPVPATASAEPPHEPRRSGKPRRRAGGKRRK